MSAGIASELPFTGERLIPGVAGLDELYFEHIVRYLLAEPLCPGSRVLDIACGAGYGSYHCVTRGARQVVGVDRAEEAIRYAGARYTAPGLSYLVGDAGAIPSHAGAFDVVLSFETIEHVPDPEGALAELARVLAPEGVLLISTPNPARYGPDGFTGQNPFHLREWLPTEFCALLQRHFPNIQLYGQRAVQGQLVWSEASDPTCWHTSLAPMDGRGIQPRAVTGSDVAGATFLIAVCSRQGGTALPPPKWICSYPTDILGAVRGYAIRLQQEYDRLRQQIGVLAQQGTQRVQAGDMDSGIVLLEAAASADPTGPALANLAVAYAMAGKTREAEQAFRNALALHPEDSLLREDADAFFRQQRIAEHSAYPGAPETLPRLASVGGNGTSRPEGARRSEQ